VKIQLKYMIQIMMNNKANKKAQVNIYNLDKRRM